MTRGSEAGFTVIEVLVAFVIAVIGLELAFQVIGTQGGLLTSGERERYAVAWADSVLSGLGTESPIVPGVQQGSLPIGRWRLTVAQASPATDDASAATTLYQVDLDVFWQSLTGESALHFATLKLVTERQVTRQ